MADETTNGRPAPVILPALSALVVVLSASIALAQTSRNWIGPGGNGDSGNWNDPGNWNPAGVPGAGDGVNISTAASPTITYDYAGPAVTLASFNFDPTIGTSTFVLSDNDLSVAGGEFLSSSGSGIPVFNQSGGTNTMTGLLKIASSTNYSSFWLSGGSLTSNSVAVGSFGQSMGTYETGFLLVSGNGILTTGGITVWPHNPASSETSKLTLSGGTINTGALTIGGDFQWSSGTLNFATNVTWDSAADPTTTSGVFGASVTASNNKSLGVTGNEILGSSSGPFTLTTGSLGSHTVSGTVTVNSGSHLNLSGGTLNVGGLNLGGVPARLNWTTGTLHLLSSVAWDGAAAGTSTSAAFGSALTVDTNKTFSMTGDESLGLNGSFALTVASGGTHSVSRSLTVNPLGQLIVNGGTVTARALQNIGSLQINAGDVSFGSVTLDSSDELHIGLSGITRGTQYGALTTTGNMILAGPLFVSLNSFAPSAGQSFDILDWGPGSLSGTFSSLHLPALAGGRVWNTSQLYTTGVLSVGLAGDFNFNGVVDAADYVVWRKGLGTTYTQNDYNVWRTHFGQSAGSGVGTSTNAAVPEPATLVLLTMAAAGWYMRRGWAHRKSQQLVNA